MQPRIHVSLTNFVKKGCLHSPIFVHFKFDFVPNKRMVNLFCFVCGHRSQVKIKATLATAQAMLVAKVRKRRCQTNNFITGNPLKSELWAFKWRLFLTPIALFDVPISTSLADSSIDFQIVHQGWVCFSLLFGKLMVCQYFRPNFLV